MEAKKFSSGFDNCLDVDYVERSGGLALLLNKETNLSIISFS